MIAAAMLILVILPSHPRTILVASHRTTTSTSTSEGANGVDIYGCLTLISAVAFPLLAINLGGNVLPWYHPLVIALLSVTPILIAAFCYIESHIAPCPVIPLKFLGSFAIFKVVLASVPIVFAWNQVCLRGAKPVLYH